MNEKDNRDFSPNSGKEYTQPPHQNPQQSYQSQQSQEQSYQQYYNHQQSQQRSYQQQYSQAGRQTGLGYKPPPRVENQIVKDAKKLSEEKKGLLLMAVTFVFSVLFSEFIIRGGFGIGVAITTIFSWVLFVPIIFKKEKSFSSGILTMIPLGILALCCAYYSTPITKFITVLVMIVLTKLQFSKLSGISAASFFSREHVRHSLRNVFFLPFECMGAAFKSVKRGKEKGEKGTSNSSKIIISLLISIPAVLFLISIFSAADEVFAYYVDAFVDWLRIDVSAILFDIIFGGLITIYLFPYMFGLQSGTPLPVKEKKKRKGIDSVYVATFLGVCTLVYMTFTAVQIGYLFNRDLPSIVGSGINYAEYARKGFGELCFIVALTFTVVLLAARFTEKKENGKMSVAVQTVLTILSASALVFVTSAICRLYWYAEAYGLTKNRVISIWFVVVLALCTLGIIFKIWVEKINLTMICGCIVVAMTIVLNFANLDYAVANYNVERYINGGADEVDMYYLSELSPAATPAVEKLLNEDGYEEVSKSVLRYYYYNDLEDKDSGSWTVQEMKAKKIIEGYGLNTYKYSSLNRWDIYNFNK